MQKKNNKLFVEKIILIFSFLKLHIYLMCKKQSECVVDFLIQDYYLTFIFHTYYHNYFTITLLLNICKHFVKYLCVYAFLKIFVFHFYQVIPLNLFKTHNLWSLKLHLKYFFIVNHIK